MKKTRPLTFHIISLFPESMASYLGESIVARAQKDGLVAIKTYNPRDFVKVGASQKGKEKPYKRVDQKPYGGGPGMVMEALPVIKAVEKALRATAKGAKPLMIFLSPSGEQFTNDYAASAASVRRDVVVICGRYEGVDARVKEVFKKRCAVEDVSVGPYVLTGGELAAMIIVDAVSRRVEGVLGNLDSLEESRAASADVYTRPEVLVYKGKKYRVPSVLLSGDHKKIEAWRAARRGDEKQGASEGRRPRRAR